MKKGREEKTKFSKILPINQIIIACCIEFRVQEMTMNEKLTMIGLTLETFDFPEAVQVFSNPSYITQSSFNSK